VGRGTGVGLVCGFDIAGCVVVEWKKGQGLVILWIGYCWLCFGRVGRWTVVGLVCGFDIAGCVVLKCEEKQGFVLIG
jgi:hypothetical protein